MIFSGDIALPYKDAIKIELPESLNHKVWFGNLEGSLLKNTDNLLNKSAVFNNYSAIEDLLNKIPFKVFGIANNHLLDAANIKTTLENLDELGVLSVGAGSNIQDARKSVLVNDENNNMFEVLAFGWNAINCIYATSTKEGVNPYTKNNVISQVEDKLKSIGEKKLVCYFHWNYELEIYPQPVDRELAYKLIDMGVFAIIGCHAHRVQGCEIYKDHPIVYGLGNFLFPQGVFMDGKIKFPDFTTKQLAFEIDSNSNFILHWFEYNKQQQQVVFLHSEDLRHSKLLKETPFKNVEHSQYRKWLKINRYHRRKFLPIFNYSGSEHIVELKVNLILLRDRLIRIIKGL